MASGTPAASTTASASARAKSPQGAPSEQALRKSSASARGRFGSGPRLVHARSSWIARDAWIVRSRFRDLNSRPAVYESEPKRSKNSRLLGGVFPRGNIEGTPSAWALALAAENVLRGAPASVAGRAKRPGVPNGR
jgi:hypothetical protein